MEFLTIFNILKSPEGAYSAILALLILSVVLYRFFQFIRSLMTSCYFFSFQVRPFILNHIIYARSCGHFLGLQSVSRLHLALGVVYILCSGICNFLGVNTMSKASSRAARLCIINLTPMFLAGGYEFGARLLGVSLHTYGSVHRTFAYVALIEGIIHVAIMARTKTLSWANHSEFYGLLVSCTLLALIILPIVRKRVYEVFLATHIACALVTIYATWQHIKSVPGKLWVFPLLYTAIFAVSELSQVGRILYRNIVLGKNPVRLVLQPHKGNVARITILLSRPWHVRAGERINLGVPQVGIFYLFQSHPFTITWWDDDRKGRATSVSLLFRPRSGFTKKILERIEPNRECGAWIDGPFGPCSVGGSGQSVGDYGHIFMVATGIGIAAQLPYIKEIIQGHNQGKVRTQRISLVWQLDRNGDWESAVDWLQSLIEQDNGYMLHVTVYDQLNSAGSTRRIGKNGLITVHSGLVEWKSQLESEIESRIGTILVTVSARAQVRHEIRDLVRARTHQDLELFEQEFQPWSQSAGLRAYLKP